MVAGFPTIPCSVAAYERSLEGGDRLHDVVWSCIALKHALKLFAVILKGVQLVEYTPDALAEVAPHVLALAAAEDLPAHGAAISVRT